MANKQILFCGNSKQYLKPELTQQSNKSNGGTAFRIPSLVNANGTLVAAIDKAATGMDWGFIEIAVRRSTDGGKSWSDIETIATPPARRISSDADNTATAFYIDPLMTVAPNGDIIMLVTYYPESKGLHNLSILDKKKAAYCNFDGAKCPLIYDRDGNYYIILSDGTVIDSSKAKTPYKVKFTNGELYKDDEYVGNIFLNGSKGKSTEDGAKTTFGAPLKAAKRSYIFMLRSTDNGASWSEPEDITGAILNEAKDGVFLGVAPGSGLTTSTGRIIMPIYSLKGTACTYSDDNGFTWRRNQNVTFTDNIDEWTAIEAPNGNLYGFSRAKSYKKTPVTISTDNGITWIKDKPADFKAPKCQKNSIVIGNKVLVSHPSGKKREAGVISIGEFDFNKKGKFTGIKWSKNEIKINDDFFAYSCMAKIDDHTIGILYEDEPSSYIVFETFEI